ncbi:hypothetical protein A8B78_07985 [Jannaschia sp. EhC01]|nr:hypothetical protein A8B78_07985 [Jannaschia sp. EhC01]
MAKLLPFKDVKFQWLNLISQDTTLSPRSIQIALYIVMVRFNGKRLRALTAHSVVAKDLNICTKTVQRSIRELRAKWFLIETGKCSDAPTTYRINPIGHEAASNLREKNQGEKPDENVRSGGQMRGQKCPTSGTEVSVACGQKRPPNLESLKHKKKKGVPPDLPKWRQSAESLVFVPGGGGRLERDWNEALHRHGIDELYRVLPKAMNEGRAGYYLPALGPGPRGSELLREQISLIRRMVEQSSSVGALSDAA